MPVFVCVCRICVSAWKQNVAHLALCRRRCAKAKNSPTGTGLAVHYVAPNPRRNVSERYKKRRCSFVALPLALHSTWPFESA